MTLTVTDDDALSDIASNQVTASAPAPSNASPQAGFAVSCQELTCTFTDQSTDADGTVASWHWDFGDGATSTQRNPSRTYAAAGQYPVSLRVTDDDGAADTQSHPANPTVTPATGSPPASVTSTTTGAVSGSPTDPRWPSPSTTRMAMVLSVPGTTRSPPPHPAARAASARRAKVPRDHNGAPWEALSWRQRGTLRPWIWGRRSMIPRRGIWNVAYQLTRWLHDRP